MQRILKHNIIKQLRIKAKVKIVIHYYISPYKFIVSILLYEILVIGKTATSFHPDTNDR